MILEMSSGPPEAEHVVSSMVWDKTRVEEL